MNDAKPCALDLERNVVAVVAPGNGASCTAVERMAIDEFAAKKRGLAPPRETRYGPDR